MELRLRIGWFGLWLEDKGKRLKAKGEGRRAEGKKRREQDERLITN
jgi:hypothetical protein